TSELGDAARDALMANLPLKRLGDPADIAAAAVFLASDAARYITGHVLHVDGGLAM
ncbi:MAG: SDR family oxidoreductase, partial [Bacteroidota bacterium]